MQVEYPDIAEGISQFIVTFIVMHQNALIQEHFDIEQAFVQLFVSQALSIGIDVEIAPTTSSIQNLKVEWFYALGERVW